MIAEGNSDSNLLYSKATPGKKIGRREESILTVEGYALRNRNSTYGDVIGNCSSVCIAERNTKKHNPAPVSEVTKPIKEVFLA